MSGIKGPGVSEVDFHVLIVFDRRVFQLPGTSYGLKKSFLANVIAFSNFENTYDYTGRVNFNPDSPKMNLKIYLILKLSHP